MQQPTDKQLISRIKKATSALCDLTESRTVQGDYWNAIRSLDRDKLAFYWSMGNTVRHQVMNVQAFNHGKKFGFEEILFDEYGWLDNKLWTQWEEIELRLKEEKAITNRITLACGQNGSWTYGLSYNYGPGSGGGWAPSIFSKPVNSRDACLAAALDDLKHKLEDRIEYATMHPDPSNYNITYMKKVLQKIADQFTNQTQLALF